MLSSIVRDSRWFSFDGIILQNIAVVGGLVKCYKQLAMIVACEQIIGGMNIMIINTT